LNSKAAKLFRRYAKEQTKSKESAKLYYKKLKAEYKAWENSK